MRFTIDRSKWRCGAEYIYKKGEGMTRLLNDEGYMCCLGQVAEQLGAPRSALRYIATPVTVCKNNEDHYGKLGLLVSGECCHGSKYMLFKNSELANAAMRINDEACKSPENREAELISLFAGVGHELIFKGEYRG